MAHQERKALEVSTALKAFLATEDSTDGTVFQAKKANRAETVLEEKQAKTGVTVSVFPVLKGQKEIAVLAALR